MKVIKPIPFLIVMIASVAIPILLGYIAGNLTIERDRYKQNTEILLQEVMQYKTKSNLNAIQTGILELKISEYEKYRAEDAATIKTLQIKNRELQNIVTAKLETRTVIHTIVRDTIINLTDTLRCIRIADKWLELDGCIKDDVFDGYSVNYERLLFTLTTEYKRFLCFLWKTKKVKNRQVDVVSLNPNTEIKEVEVIEIRK